MAVTPDLDQSGIDPVLAVLQQEFGAEYSSRVLTIAKSWADGLKGILGLAGLAGIVGAPIASLADTTKMVVGLLLAAIFVVSIFGLLLVQSAASGTVQRFPMPGSMTELLALQRRIADRAVASLRVGRVLACSALLLFGVAIGVAWADPWKSDQALFMVTTSKGTVYCGPVMGGDNGAITVKIAPGVRQRIRLLDVQSIAPTAKSCKG